MATDGDDDSRDDELVVVKCVACDRRYLRENAVMADGLERCPAPDCDQSTPTSPRLPLHLPTGMRSALDGEKSTYMVVDRDGSDPCHAWGPLPAESPLLAVARVVDTEGREWSEGTSFWVYPVAQGSDDDFARFDVDLTEVRDAGVLRR